MIKCGYIKDSEMPDGKIVKRQEAITFSAKQFFIYNPPKLKDGETLLFRDDIDYLVSFKRLHGSFDVYSKIVNRFLKHQDIREVINFELMDMDPYHVSNTDKPFVVSGFIRFSYIERYCRNNNIFPMMIKRIIMDFV